jgi:glutamate dehydrogenase/leucine dehydrogenase
VLTRNIAEQGVFALPGQLLTLGGALTSRLEWFWRQSRPEQPFDKQLAHTVVAEVVKFTVATVMQLAEEQGQTPYEAMLDYAEHLTPLLPV